MHSPFSSCQSFVKKGKKKRQKPQLHTLTVDFKCEEDEPALQKFREFQDALFDRLVALCRARDQDVGKTWAEKNKVPVCRLIKKKEDPDPDDDIFPDKMSLKFDPQEVSFFDEDNESLQYEDIEFDEYVVQPVAQLRDVFKYKGTYYPRYFLHSCKLSPIPEEE